MRVAICLVGCALAASASDVYSSRDALTSKHSFQANCESFKSKINVPNAVVHSVTYVPAGANISMANVPNVCSSNKDGEASPFEFCRVSLNVTTSTKSQIFMEAWLPSNYSERFLSTGNGGLGGCMFLPVLCANYTNS